MCTGRIDLAFVLRAFAKGADGVFVGGCHLNDCNYTTHGNFYALRMVRICQRLLAEIGIDPGRLRIEFISGGEGNRFAEIVNEFSETVRSLGPLGGGEGADPEALRFRLETATKLVPYIKLLERERLRLQFRTREEYDAFFGSEEFGRLFRETIGEKLAATRIALLLKDRPLSTGEIAEALGLAPAAISRQLNRSSRQGLVRYDSAQNCYALA
jgi:coenzyme F420-reducing hydrogenase delta subunit/DNA-binding transcriptional ArsR family regulator